MEIVNLCEENVDNALLVCASSKLRDDENAKSDWKLEKALYREITCAATHIAGNLILPLQPQQF